MTLITDPTTNPAVDAELRVSRAAIERAIAAPKVQETDRLDGVRAELAPVAEEAARLLREIAEARKELEPTLEAMSFDYAAARRRVLRAPEQLRRIDTIERIVRDARVALNSATSDLASVPAAIADLKAADLAPAIYNTSPGRTETGPIGPHRIRALVANYRNRVASVRERVALAQYAFTLLAQHLATLGAPGPQTGIVRPEPEPAPRQIRADSEFDPHRA
jgi:hypothetical protein